MPDREFIDRLTKDLIDRGQLIEAGWTALRYMSVPLDAPQIQIEEMRNAFFAGAQHLYGSILGVLDPGEEPTDADLRRMELIDKELTAFIYEHGLRHGIIKGSA